MKKIGRLIMIAGILFMVPSWTLALITGNPTAIAAPIVVVTLGWSLMVAQYLYDYES